MKSLQSIWTKGNRAYTLIFSVMLILLAVMFFYQIGNRPLIDYDEAIYAQVSREALEAGRVTTFHWLGNLGLDRAGLWAEKPPLMLWLIQTGFLVFGVNELGARVWVALFALGTVVVTFLFAKKLFNSSAVGLLAIATYFVSYQFLEAASLLQFDIPVGFFILLSLYLFYLGLKDNPKYFYWFGAALAGAMLTKNVVGLMPVLIIAIYSLFSFNFSYFKEKKFWLSILIFFAIVIPWHLIETVQLGKAFWDQYLFYHLLRRFSEPLEGNTGNFWFFWDLIKEGRVLFWLSIVGFAFSVIQSFRNKKNYLYVAVATLVIFLFFSISKTKLPAYILVIFPYLAILSGAFLSAVINKILKVDSLLSKIALVGVVVVFAYFGIKFNDYKLTKQFEQRRVDARLVGNYLKNEQTELPVYYSSWVGTSPSMIFYSNRVVNFLKYSDPEPEENFLLISDITPDYPTAKPIYKTPTHSVYEVKSRP